MFKKSMQSIFPFLNVNLIFYKFFPVHVSSLIAKASNFAQNSPIFLINGLPKPIRQNPLAPA